MTLRTLDYGNYGIFLIMGNAGFCPSTVGKPYCFVTAKDSNLPSVSLATQDEPS